MHKQNIVLTLVVVIAIAISSVAFQPTVNVQVESPSSSSSSFGSNAGPNSYGPLEFNGGVKYGSVNSTSTIASMTLRVSDVQDVDTVVVSPTGAASAKTLTFFASSSAPAWLPRVGDRQNTCFLNSTTTSGVNIVFAAGTGIDLQVATSTGSGGAMDLTIAPGGTGCFNFIRATSTASSFDIQANLLEYEDGD